MILIIGSTKDDVLYFDSVMTQKRTEKLFNYVNLTFGRIFNQEIVLVDGVQSSYLSGAVVSYLIDKYFIILAIVVGKCTAFSEDLKIGDIVVSRRLFIGDVDLVEETNSSIGQLPNFPIHYDTPSDVIEYINNSLEARVLITHKTGTYVSANASYSNDRQIEAFRVDNQLFGHSRCVVFDTIGAGVAMSSHLFNIPFVCVKVVSKKFKQTQSAKAYEQVLKNYASVGKAIVATIGDIGRNDIIRG